MDQEPDAVKGHGMGLPGASPCLPLTLAPPARPLCPYCSFVVSSPQLSVSRLAHLSSPQSSFELLMAFSV